MSAPEEGPVGGEGPSQALVSPPDQGVLLVGTPKEWFKSALEAVLEPEGYTVSWAEDAERLRDALSTASPDLVILDENLPSTDTPDLCRSLLAGPLSPAVPVLLYSSDMTTEHLQARALEAGAWEVLREPVRAEYLVATIRRLLGISRLVRDFRGEETDEWEPGVLGRSGFRRVVPLVIALAAREGVSLSCVVLGPTAPESGEAARRQREVTARLCRRYLRKADLCGWIDDRDVAIMAYGTSPDDAALMTRRLEALTGEVDENGAFGLSAGIVSVAPEDDERGGEDTEQLRRLGRAPDSVLEAARAALEDAREQGGGIKTVDTGDGAAGD